jgi:hypothetical protein
MTPEAHATSKTVVITRLIRIDPDYASAVSKILKSRIEKFLRERKEAA